MCKLTYDWYGQVAYFLKMMLLDLNSIYLQITVNKQSLFIRDNPASIVNPQVSLGVILYMDTIVFWKVICVILVYPYKKYD